MIIEPKVREYICTTAHPQGCAESVRNQADYACKQGMVNGTKKALIIGCSTGYGLASRICALENCGADTLGIMFERQANGRRTATPGWYNTYQTQEDAGQADAIFVVSMDRATEKIKVLFVPRDSMTEIEVFNPSGKSLGMTTDHINIQYAFGDGRQKSCELMKTVLIDYCEHKTMLSQ